MQDLGYELRRIPIPRTTVNKGSKPLYVGYIELLLGSVLLGEKGDTYR
jgi:hypothetical protein